MPPPGRASAQDPADDWSDAFDTSSHASPPTPRVWTVSEITRQIKSALDDFGRVSVEGEVTRVTRAASGHLYFDLKDLDSKIACTIWRSQVPAALRFDLKEGMQVVAHGRLDVYGPRGTYSLNVQRLEETGIGVLLAKLEELKADLKSKGWFDRKRPLPSMPRLVGVATSRDGAAFQDFLRTRSLRWPLYPVLLAHTSVQGAAAAGEIAAAIRRLDASGVDVIVVCRGGGSLEDLWAFNERPVAEAIWRATVPVVTGVGHETDVTLADLVADHRAHTPTDAAQTVIPDRAELLADLDRKRNYLMQAVDGVLCAREERLARAAASPALRDAAWILDRRAEVLEGQRRALRLAAGRLVETASSRLSQASVRLARQSPAVRLERASTRLVALAPRLTRSIVRPLESAERRVGIARASLDATSPFAVLERGYSITRRAGESAPLRAAAALGTGERIETILRSGWIVSTVEKTGEDGPAAAGAAPEVESARRAAD